MPSKQWGFCECEPSPEGAMLLQKCSRAYQILQTIESPMHQRTKHTLSSECTLISVQPTSQIPRTPHKLLVFMLLHLQLPLPLHAYRKHTTILCHLFPIPFLAYIHAFTKSGRQGCLLLQRGTVSHIRDLAMLIGRFLNRQDSCVSSEL
jgi:hypothetical protein